MEIVPVCPQRHLDRTRILLHKTHDHLLLHMWISGTKLDSVLEERTESAPRPPPRPKARHLHDSLGVSFRQHFLPVRLHHLQKLLLDLRHCHVLLRDAFRRMLLPSLLHHLNTLFQHLWYCRNLFHVAFRHPKNLSDLSAPSESLTSASASPRAHRLLCQWTQPVVSQQSSGTSWVNCVCGISTVFWNFWAA